MSGDSLIVTKTYAQWVTRPTKALKDDDVARLAVSDVVRNLVDYCDRNFLRRVSDIDVMMRDAKRASLASPDFVDSTIFVAEVRANGLPPERRLPRGRWSWLRMP